ncbi:hypothetical protein EYF80_067990 [Liparis tanakae]|uniref:Uncharacterized protein n=1 Tax=Liparis tanakae TaxID=230148 RepID=A0A4Z2DZK8_9TELE|nr:hypothetical protein EYF80_067990 [Liparis tanakae]
MISVCFLLSSPRRSMRRWARPRRPPCPAWWRR